MKIVKLEAENFKRLVAVEIAPDGNIVTIGGNNGQGKSSVLDAIWVALAGLSAAPPKPIRDGEEKAVIKLDLGEYVVTRSFVQKDGERFTHNVKVEDAEGRRYPSPQELLNQFMGEVGFDPFDFILKKPEDQAEMLMELVPLSIDLDALEEKDAANFADRTEVNRRVRMLEAELEAIPEQELPENIPDQEDLIEAIASAGERNGELREEARRRAGLAVKAQEYRDSVEKDRQTILIVTGNIFG